MSKAYEARRGGTEKTISKSEFEERFNERFDNPAFDEMRDEIARLREIAYKSYAKGEKAPRTEKAGAGFQDPDYDLNVHWAKANQALRAAEKEFETADVPHILLINGSDRNEGTCPGEVSKSQRLMDEAIKEFQRGDEAFHLSILNLSEMTAEFGKVIYPCKGCVSTAMPLCHYPCSCYPHQSLGQVDDWMNDIYPMFARAHGILIVSPVYWRQAPGALKLLMDRMVCADGGNRDPTSTQGKTVELAKKLELDGWDFPRHLKGRVYSVIVHGDSEGVDELKTALTSWLENMYLVPAGTQVGIARYIGYLEPYATSHEALDKDEAIFAEVRNSAIALKKTILEQRRGFLSAYNLELDDPRPK